MSHILHPIIGGKVTEGAAGIKEIRSPYSGDVVGSESPLIGDLYYLRRALEPYTEVREGDLKTLLARDLSVYLKLNRIE